MFKLLAEFPGYRVSDAGVVESKWNKQWGMTADWHPLATYVLKNRLQVTLFRDGERIDRAVHTLVLETFVGPRPAGMAARHKDGDIRNVRLSNLVWGKPEKVADEHVAEIRRRVSAGESQRSVAREYGLSKSTVSLMMLRKGPYA